MKALLKSSRSVTYASNNPPNLRITQLDRSRRLIELRLQSPEERLETSIAICGCHHDRHLGFSQIEQQRRHSENSSKKEKHDKTLLYYRSICASLTKYLPRPNG